MHLSLSFTEKYVSVQKPAHNFGRGGIKYELSLYSSLDHNNKKDFPINLAAKAWV